MKCGVRFTTYERIQRTGLMVIKRDGRREEFYRDKLLQSVRLACVKRPLPTGALEKLVDEIENDLQRLGRAEVPSQAIGEMVIRKLREIDRVAYIRYASVYRDFEDLEEFEREIQDLQAGSQTAQSSEQQLALMPQELAIPPKPRARRGRRPGVTVPSRAANQNGGGGSTEQ